MIHHLQCSHDYLRYEFCRDQIGNFHVIVRRDRSVDYKPDLLANEKKFAYEGSKEKRSALTQFAIPNIFLASQPVDADIERAASSNSAAAGCTESRLDEEVSKRFRTRQ